MLTHVRVAGSTAAYLLLLPSQTQKKDVYAKLKTWIDDPENAAEVRKVVNRAQFIRAWDSARPNIRIHKKGTDYCDECTKYRLLASRRSTNEEGKARFLDHCAAARNARAFYKFLTDYTAQHTDRLHINIDYVQNAGCRTGLRSPARVVKKSIQKVDVTHGLGMLWFD